MVCYDNKDVALVVLEEVVATEVFVVAIKVRA